MTHATKIVFYGTAELMTARGVAVELLLGAVMVGGTYLGKWLVDRVSEATFVLLVEAVLVAAGVHVLVV